MARYFFHTANGAPYQDVEGLELPTAHAAELEAIRFLGELLTQDPEAFRSSQLLTLTVTEGRQHVAFGLQASITSVIPT